MVKGRDFMMLASFIDSIDDVRRLYGVEYAEQFALRLVYYGVRGEKYCDFDSICNATLESIFPKIDASKERSDRKKREVINRSKQTKEEGEKDKNMGEV